MRYLLGERRIDFNQSLTVTSDAAVCVLGLLRDFDERGVKMIRIECPVVGWMRLCACDNRALIVLVSSYLFMVVCSQIVSSALLFPPFHVNADFRLLAAASPRCLAALLLLAAFIRYTEVMCTSIVRAPSTLRPAFRSILSSALIEQSNRSIDACAVTPQFAKHDIK